MKKLLKKLLAVVGTLIVMFSVSGIANVVVLADTHCTSSDSVAEGTKKGVCASYYGSTDLPKYDKVGASWIYNWGIVDGTSESAKQLGMEYVPMVWGAGSVNSSTLEKLTQGAQNGTYKNLLTFNEPDLSVESNMTVDQAIALWPSLMATGLRLGSPAPCTVDSTWLDQFMIRAEAENLRVDFIALHVYQDFTDPNAVSQLKTALENIYHKYHRPIWITEIGCVDVSTQWAGYTPVQTPSAALSSQYITNVTNMLESLYFVERYAWFVDYSSHVGTIYTRLYDVSTGNLTEQGQAYANATSTKPLVSLDRTGWEATAVSNRTSANQVESNVLDGDKSTVWMTQAQREAGSWFQIDMKRSNKVKSIILDSGTYSGNYLEDYKVYTSLDGAAYTEVKAGTLTSKKDAIILDQMIDARYIKIVSTTRNSNWYSWAISELEVVGEESNKAITATATVRASDWTLVKKNNVSDLLFDNNSNTYWSSGIAQNPNNQYIEMDLQSEKLIKSLTVNAGNSDYAKSYKVSYYKDGETAWSHTYVTGTCQNSVYTITFPQSIQARYINIQPYSTRDNIWWSVAEISFDFN